MTTTATASGVVSHHRSLLIWPGLIDQADQLLLRAVVATGARLLAFGGPLPAAVEAGVPGRPLPVWAAPHGGTALDPVTTGQGMTGRAVTTRRPTPAQWAAVQRLHAQAGLVPLPYGTRNDAAWTHARATGPTGDLLATASAQALPRPPLPGCGPALVCGVSTRPDALRTGAATSCVAAVTGPAGAAAITEDPAAAAYFRRLGWTPAGDVWLHRWP